MSSQNCQNVNVLFTYDIIITSLSFDYIINVHKQIIITNKKTPGNSSSEVLMTEWRFQHLYPLLSKHLIEIFGSSNTKMNTCIIVLRMQLAKFFLDIFQALNHGVDSAIFPDQLLKSEFLYNLNLFLVIIFLYIHKRSIYPIYAKITCFYSILTVLVLIFWVYHKLTKKTVHFEWMKNYLTSSLRVGRWRMIHNFSQVPTPLARG